MKTLSTEQFILKARKVHGDFFNYDHVKYRGCHEKITITCPFHGDFETTPVLHLKGCRCPKCMKVKPQMNTKQFIEAAKQVHGDRYDYSKVVYEKSIRKVEIICRHHGSFFVTPNNHLSKRVGCPTCALNRRKNTLDRFIEKARSVHGDKYDYSKVEYKDRSTRVQLICPEHGPFWITPEAHINRISGCPKCSMKKVMNGESVEDFLGRHVEVIPHDRTVLDGDELDFYIPSRNLAIEFDSLRHNNDRKTNHIFEKTKKCMTKGIKLIHVFEDEWRDRNRIVRSRLLHACGVSCFGRIYARKCEPRIISTTESANFVQKYHIQGKVGASVHLGLYYKKRLVAVMTFKKPRFNTHYKWELLRYCTLSNFSIIGGASKLLSFFRENYQGSIITYADRRWSDGNLYKKLGFKFLQVSAPAYFYYKTTEENPVRFSRVHFQKHKLHKLLNVFDPKLSEGANMRANDWERVFDCGNYAFGME